MRSQRIAIMQPYFFPYIGYFQLLDAADQLVLYDNLQYSKQGWVNRNRFLCNGQPSLFTIPIKRASDYLDIDQREVSADFNRDKLLNRVDAAYRKAPYRESALELFSRCVRHEETNLFQFLWHSIEAICHHLEIATPMIRSSVVTVDHSLRGKEKVIAICQANNAGVYINPIGGTELYDEASFAKVGVRLRFLSSEMREYQQDAQGFVPWLSILDLLMYNSRESVIDYVRTGYSLVEHAAAA